MLCSSQTVQSVFRRGTLKGGGADDPLVKGRRMIMANVQAGIVDGEYEKLDDINLYHVHVACFEVGYGGCKYGIVGAACPVEALHALENGLMKQSL